MTNSSNGSSRRGDITLVLISTFLTLAVVEAGMRLWLNFFASDRQAGKYALASEIEPTKRQYSPHHYLSYYPTPNYERGLTRHNSLGYRDREFSVNKPAGVFRIVALGGSTTYTVKVQDNEKMFTRQLESILHNEYDHPSVEVINAGVGGYSSWESLINLEFRVLDLDPDLIIIYHGTNDVHTRLVEADSYAGDNAGRRKYWQAPSHSILERYSILARWLSRKLGLGFGNQASLDAYVSAPNYLGAPDEKVSPEQAMHLLQEHQPTYLARNLRNMAAVAQAHDVDVLLATWAHSPAFDDYAASNHYQLGFQQNNAVVRQVARELGVALIDFAAQMPSEQQYWSDGRHVNEEGALIKAQLFARFLASSGLLATN